MISENHFDRLPDDVVCLILNRVHHAKSLCACLAVSTRFNYIALRSTNLSLSVDRIHFDDADGDGDEDEEDSDRSISKDSLLRSLFKLIISTPIRFLTRLASLRGVFVESSSTAATFYSPTQALKSFENIQILKIQLPSHRELHFDSTTNPIIKWKATFGSELKTCVIVAATLVNPIPDNDLERRDAAGVEIETHGKVKEENQQATATTNTTPFAISNEDLKMRVVWTISCLIAASSRHHLLKRVVSQHQTLKSIEMVDQRRQGTLTMNESEISEMRESLTLNLINSDSRLSDEGEGERSRIPAVKMKMWHVAELELPGCKKVMKGATLVVIGAGDDGVEEVGMEEVFDDEAEMMYGEAAREIRRKMKRSYSLEMEAF